MIIVGELGLTIPIQTKTASTEVVLQPESVQIWLGMLPLTDTGQTAKQLYTVLKESNGVILDAKQRFRILELLYESIQHITKALEKHFLNQQQALNQKQITVINLANTLEMQLASGYKLVVEQIDKNHSSSNLILEKSIEKILDINGKLLLRSTLLYAKAPQTLWKETHLLYKLAKNLKLTLASKNNTIVENYKIILLFSCIDPYRWRQNEQLYLYEQMSKWSQQTQFISEPLPENKHLFVIDIEADSPPVPFNSEKIVLSHHQTLYFDLQTLADNLSIALESKQGECFFSRGYLEELKRQLPVHGLKKLIKRWKSVVRSRALRKHTSKDIRITFGLKSTHYFLNEETVLKKLKKIEEDNTLENPHFCQLIDISVNGFLVVWSNTEYPPVQAGDLIGIQILEAQDNPTWHVGCIRWLKRTTLQEIKLGIELLASHPKACGMQLIKDAQPIGCALQGIVMYEGFDKTEPTGILTPRTPFKIEDNILLHLPNQVEPMQIQLTQLLDSTNTYLKFQCVLLEKQTNANPVENNSAMAQNNDQNKDEFDSIWSSL